MNYIHTHLLTNLENDVPSIFLNGWSVRSQYNNTMNFDESSVAL